jgi:hypothetical protein
MQSSKKHTFEIIFVGPYGLPIELQPIHNVKYIKDFGCPSRCLQLGSYFAEGEYLAWCSDDCRIISDKFDEAIEYFDKNLSENDCMNMRYSEGANFTGTQHNQAEYWIARTHTDLRFDGVKENWKIAPIFMYKRQSFYKYGGIDCRFEHVNMNTHDLSFYIQEKGWKIIDSPSRVFQFDHQPHKSDYPPILISYIENDRPLFYNLYKNLDAAKNRNINFENWRNADSIWKRRFK